MFRVLHTMRTSSGADLFLTWFAVVSVRLTLLPGVTWLTLALVASHGVMANSTIAARTLHTLVDIDLTGLT